MRVVAFCFAQSLFFMFNPPAAGREWHAADGSHSIEADYVDIIVVLKRKDGETAKVPISKLSTKDRKYIHATLNSLIALEVGGVEASARTKGQTSDPSSASTADKGKNVPVAIEGEMPQGTGTGIRRRGNEVLSTTPSAVVEFSALTEFAELNLNEFDRRLYDPEKYQGLYLALLAHREIEPEQDNYVDVLMSLDSSLRHILHPVGDPLIAAGTMNELRFRSLVVLFGELSKALSALAPNEGQVSALYATRIETLKSAPSPQDRAHAALWLCGADGVADIAVPALAKAADEDASKDVQMAAAIALGAFTRQRNIAQATLLRKLKNTTDESEQFVIIWALSQSDSKSPVVRKYVREYFDRYGKAGQSSFSMDRMLEFLHSAHDQRIMATTELLDAAKVSAMRDGGHYFRTLSKLLIQVASSDKRVLRFFESQSKNGPERVRVYCDSVVKQILAEQKQN